MASPVVEKSLIIKCPEGSPPKLEPVLVISSKTYLSPTFVLINSIPIDSKYFSRDKLAITVEITLLLFNKFLCFREKAIIAIKCSPSISLPSSSTKTKRSPSPSNAIPKSALLFRTSALNFFVFVEPQF